MLLERVLVADDDPIMRSFIAETLRRTGREVLVCVDGHDAIQRLQEEAVDLIISDKKMPRKGGLDLLQFAKSLPRPPFFILVTAFGTVESAVEAMQLGAHNYLIKPFSPEALETAVQRCEESAHLIKENRYLREELKKPEMIAKSPSMQRIVQNLDKIAQSQASVFITGESGTGKEVIAGAIHRRSLRSSQPFIKLNCAAIPETLLESELFGHERGAFTGALHRKTGRFELADKGTLLLDEVTEIPLALQPKLLRAIQEQEFERVGGIRSLRVNIRFIATSNRSMQEAIETKIFREDLFYRLNVIPIHLPPLRERIEDIIPLAETFIQRFCQENHKEQKKLTDRAIQKLLNYHWPGNVRELANILERTVVLDFEEAIDANHLYLQPMITKPPQGNFVGLSLHAVEKRLILETLEAHHHNRNQTAAILGISVRTLRNKLQEYGAEASTES